MLSGGGGGCGSEPAAVAEVGRMVDSSQADDRRMIRLVRERRLLYARNNMPVASYYTQVKNLWEEVAQKMGWSVSDVRRKWSHIRNSYSRHLRNEAAGARTGRGRAVSRWYLADELEFLRDHMATDTRPSPYSPYAPASFLELDLSEAGAGCGGEPGDVKPGAWLPRAGWGEPGGAHSEDSSASSQAFGADENSSYFQFFRGIHADYRELSPRARRLFKRQCLAALHRLLDDEEGGRGPGAGQYSPRDTDDDETDQKICVVEHVNSYSILPTD